MLAYYETVRNGLIPVKVVGWRTQDGFRYLCCQVTAARPGYRRLELFNASPLHTFPRDHVRRTKYTTYVRGFDWSNAIP